MRFFLLIEGESSQPDIILLDVLMPEMDGYEVCRRLNADENTCEIPVIFVTAMNDVDDETKGLRNWLSVCEEAIVAV